MGEDHQNTFNESQTSYWKLKDETSDAISERKVKQVFLMKFKEKVNTMQYGSGKIIP